MTFCFYSGKHQAFFLAVFHLVPHITTLSISCDITSCQMQTQTNTRCDEQIYSLKTLKMKESQTRKKQPVCQCSCTHDADFSILQHAGSHQDLTRSLGNSSHSAVSWEDFILQLCISAVSSDKIIMTITFCPCNSQNIKMKTHLLNSQFAHLLLKDIIAIYRCDLYCEIRILSCCNVCQKDEDLKMKKKVLARTVQLRDDAAEVCGAFLTQSDGGDRP